MLNVLYSYISTSRSLCAVPNMAVICSSLTSCLARMWFGYFLNYFQMVPIAPLVTGIIIVFAFHMLCISVVRLLYFRLSQLPS